MKHTNRILCAMLCLVMVATLIVPSVGTRAIAAADPADIDYSWCSCVEGIDSAEDLVYITEYHSYTITVAPTVEQAGTLVGYCSRCKGHTNIEVPALNDTDYAVEETAAGACVTPGKAVYTWNETAYGEFEFEVETECIGHQYVDGVCTRCGDKEADFSDWCECNQDDSNEDLPPESLEDMPLLPVEAYYNYEVVAAPTLTETGMLKVTCTRCHGVTWVELPVLSEADYDIETVAEPSAENPGTDRYTWKDKTFGEYCFDVETEADLLPAPEVTLSNVATTGKIKVAWTAVEGAAKYEVWRAETKDGPYTKLKTTTSLSLVNTSTEAGIRYFYQVRALDAEGNPGEFSEPKSRTCDLPRIQNVTVSNLDSGFVRLDWEPVEGAVSYRVFRATSEDGEYTARKVTTGLYYINDTGADIGKTYYYKVVAMHEVSAANSVKSLPVSGMRKLAKPVVTGTHVASTGKNKLTWEAVEGAVGYQIYRSENKEDGYTLMKETEALSYVNTTSKAGMTYYYKVVAVYSDPAANSVESTVKTLTCDLPQPKVTGSVNAKGKPKLTWEAVEGAIKYTVYRADSADGEYTAMKTTESLTYTNTSAEAGKTYYYKVKAVAEKSAANSALSAAVKVTAK